MGKKSTLLYLLWRKRFWVESYRIGQLRTIRVKNCITYPSKGHLRSPEVTNRHLSITWSKRDRDMGLVSVRSSWPGKSSDMQYDPFRLSRDLGKTWPEVKLWPWPFKVILYMVRRALTRQTQWYNICCSIFKIKDFIVEKPFWKILEFWPLETPILTWAKKWPKWFRNYFSRAFERCLPFFSTATRSRDHGGGGVQTPPQQAVENPEAQQGAGHAHCRGVWESHRLEGGGHIMPLPSISAPVRTAVTNFGEYLGQLYNFSGTKFGTVGQSRHGQKGSSFKNVDTFDQKERFSGFSFVSSVTFIAMKNLKKDIRKLSKRSFGNMPSYFV